MSDAAFILQPPVSLQVPGPEWQHVMEGRTPAQSSYATYY